MFNVMRRDDENTTITQRLSDVVFLLGSVLILFKMIESIDMTLCVISFLVIKPEVSPG